MRIGVIGSGMVGQRLGAGFIAEGHEVVLGSREPERPELQQWKNAAGPQAQLGRFGTAAAFGEWVVLATHWSGTENAIWLADPKLMRGKIVIDATNPLRVFGTTPPQLDLGFTDSGGEQVQRWIPDGRIVKCFNTVNANLMYRPSLPEGPADMFLCGNDPQANREVSQLVESFGWRPVDLGNLEQARLLEPLAMIWIRYGFQHNHWTHAWKLINR